MGITIIKQPDQVNLSLNPIPMVLQTDNWETTPGTQAILIVRISNGSTPPDYLELTFPGYTVRIDFVTGNPDDSGTQIEEYTGGILGDWVGDVVTGLQCNYLLDTNYEISYGGLIQSQHAIVFLARNIGPLGSLTVNNLPSTWTSFINTPGVDPTQRINFKIILDLQEEVSPGIFDTFHSEALAPDSANQIESNLEDVFASFLEFDLPSFLQTTYSQANSVIKNFKIRYAESFGDPIAVQKAHRTNEFFVLHGGISHDQYPGFDFWNTFMPTNKKFLSWYPGDKKVSAGQQEYLYFISQSAGNWEMEVTIYYDDQTNTVITPFSHAGTTVGEVYILPAGHDQLGLHLVSPSKTIIDWSIQLSDGASPITETRRYIMDRHCYYNERFILCLNSLGGSETIRCLGEQEFRFGSSGFSFEKVQEYDYAGTDAQMGKVITEGESEFKLNTGWLRKEEAEFLQELLRADQTWLIGPDRFIPITIDSGKSLLVNDRSQLYAVEFRYSLAFRSIVFTPE